MKKAITALLVLVITITAIGFAACGNGGSGNNDKVGITADASSLSEIVEGSGIDLGKIAVTFTAADGTTRRLSEEELAFFLDGERYYGGAVAKGEYTLRAEYVYGGETYFAEIGIRVKEKTENTEYVTVTFDSDGGSAVPQQIVKKGDKVSEPRDPIKVPTSREEYIFAGWYLGEKKWDFDSDATDSDVTLKAKYKVVKFTEEFLPSK